MGWGCGIGTQVSQASTVLPRLPARRQVLKLPPPFLDPLSLPTLPQEAGMEFNGLSPLLVSSPRVGLDDSEVFRSEPEPGGPPGGQPLEPCCGNPARPFLGQGGRWGCRLSGRERSVKARGIWFGKTRGQGEDEGPTKRGNRLERGRPEQFTSLGPWLSGPQPVSSAGRGAVSQSPGAPASSSQGSLRGGRCPPWALASH